MHAKWLHLHSAISEFSHLLVRGSGHAILFHAVNVISIYLSAYSLMSHICFIKFHPTSFTTIFPCSLFYEHIVLTNSTKTPSPKNNIQPTATNTEGHPLVFSGVPPAEIRGFPMLSHLRTVGNSAVGGERGRSAGCAFVAEVKTTGFRIAMGKQQSRNLFLVDLSGFVLCLSLFGWCVFSFVGGRFFLKTVWKRSENIPMIQCTNSSTKSCRKYRFLFGVVEW